MKLFVDQCGIEVKIPDKPKRIISLVPSQTELLFELGLSEEVVGITKFCVHPDSWFRSKQKVGGTKSVNFEKVKSLDPSLIIANKEENSKEDIEELSKHFPVWISDVVTLEDAQAMIEQVGDICDCKARAEEINQNIRSQFSNLKPLEKNSSCLYLIWQNPYMLAGADTFINTMLNKCGFENLAIEKEGRYPEITEEKIHKANADYLFLSSEPFPFKEKYLLEFQKKFPQTKAILVDGEMFSWYGSRLQLTPKYLNALIDSVKKVL